MERWHAYIYIYTYKTIGYIQIPFEALWSNGVDLNSKSLGKSGYMKYTYWPKYPLHGFVLGGVHHIHLPIIQILHNGADAIYQHQQCKQMEDRTLKILSPSRSRVRLSTHACFLLHGLINFYTNLNILPCNKAMNLLSASWSVELNGEPKAVKIIWSIWA